MNLLDGLDVDIPNVGSAPASRPAAVPPESAPEFFGPYQLIQKVGEGGVAKVMRSRHIHPSYAEQTFAIKILHDKLSRDPNVASLFRREAYVLSLLKHPNIVRTFEAGVQDNRLFIAMEYIDGRDLDNMLLRCKKWNVPVPIPVAMFLVGEVLKALSYAHSLTDADGKPLGLIHRDVNPANVFLSYDGGVKLGDFGVASVLAGQNEEQRELAGKAGYFAPEQLEGEEVDQRADIFAVGVMMFEMLSGARLFEADSTDKLLRLNRKAKVPRPSKLNPAISEDLEAVILKALERKPQARFASAGDMLAALRPFIPEPAGMSLAVAALMRNVFLSEHIQELQLRQGLAGAGPDRGAGQYVAVCTADVRAQSAFNDLLHSRGYRVTLHPSVEHLGQALLASAAPQLVLVDVSSPAFSLESFNAVLSRWSAKPAALVAVSDSLETEWLKRADAIGAVDLLFKPFNVERVLTSVRAALAGAVSIAAVVSTSAGAVAAVAAVGPKVKVLLLTKDPALATRVSAALGERHFIVEVSPTAEEALERVEHTSYQAVIYDAHPASPRDRHFAADMRKRPGVGLIPVVYLASPEDHAVFAGVDADRSAVRPRQDPAVVLEQTIQRLRADTRLGRTFTRYSCRFPVQFRYGGRVFTGEAVNISRGGVMLRCEQMPPVGTRVSVNLTLPGASRNVEVNAIVVRVDLERESNGAEQAGIGVEFEQFAGRAESELIAYVAALDSRAPERHSVPGGAAVGVTPN